MEASKKEPNILQTYEELKTEFENHACRIDDVLLYPVLDTKNERTLYTLLQLKERFSHLTFSRFALGYERRRGKCARVSFEVDCFSMKGLITDVSLYLRPLHKQSFEVDNLAGFILAVCGYPKIRLRFYFAHPRVK